MKHFKHIFIFIGVLFLANCGDGSELENNIRNFKALNDNISTGGLVNTAAIPALKTNGFDIIIDARTAAEGIFNEQKAVQDAGMSYFNIPLDGSNIPDESVNMLAKVLAEHKDKKILIHCASGNRVGGLWAAYQINQGTEFNNAMQQGKNIGMGGHLEQWLTSKHK